MDQHDSMADLPRRRQNLLRDKVQLVKRKDSDRYEIVRFHDPLSFVKGFFVVIRACQLLAQHNDGIIFVGVAGSSGAGKTVFTEKLVNFMPDVAMISMVNYTDATRIIDGNFDDPRLTDYDTLLENIHGLKEGRSVQVPIYDFKSSCRTGYRTVDVPSSRIVIIEGIYALSEKLRSVIDLRVSVTGGVHFDLMKRVLRDIQRADQEPEEIIRQISETVYPMYKAFIEPDLETAQIKIINKFNPFSGFQNPMYILKSPRSLAPEKIKAVLGDDHTESNEETYDIYLLPLGEDPESCQSYLRMRNREGKYNLMFEEWVIDTPFIISARLTFEVSVRLLGGLMALGYTIEAILKRSSCVFSDGKATVKIDRLEQLNRQYIQVQGRDRLYVKFVADQLGLDGSYIPRTYIEQIQLEKLALPEDLKTKFSIDDELVSSPKEAFSHVSADRRNKLMKSGLSQSYSMHGDKNIVKLRKIRETNTKFGSGRALESPAINQGAIEQIQLEKLINDVMVVHTSEGETVLHEDSGYMELKILERLVNESEEPIPLKYALLHSITENFAEKKEIGRGGCGIVYKGILRNGVVAVKRLHNIRTIEDKMFHREVKNLFKVKHPNIVRLLGYSSFTEEHAIQSEGTIIMAEIRERLLCFEYIRNGSLDQHLSDELRGLEWRTRYQIIIGICRGLNYLHKDKEIIHMDLKPSNILLDDLLVPKITDFGLSRLRNDPQDNSRLISLGYTAPEYISGGKATRKSDIYSLGVIIIELVTGTKTDPNITNVIRRWNHRWIESMEQSSLGYQQVAKCLELALRCKQDEPADRPDISYIIDELTKIDTDGQAQIQISPCCSEDILGIEPLDIQASSHHDPSAVSP